MQRSGLSKQLRGVERCKTRRQSIPSAGRPHSGGRSGSCAEAPIHCSVLAKGVLPLRTAQRCAGPPPRSDSRIRRRSSAAGPKDPITRASALGLRAESASERPSGLRLPFDCSGRRPRIVSPHGREARSKPLPALPSSSPRRTCVPVRRTSRRTSMSPRRSSAPPRRTSAPPRRTSAPPRGTFPPPRRRVFDSHAAAAAAGRSGHRLVGHGQRRRRIGAVVRHVSRSAGQLHAGWRRSRCHRRGIADRRRTRYRRRGQCDRTVHRRGGTREPAAAPGSDWLQRAASTEA